MVCIKGAAWHVRLVHCAFEKDTKKDYNPCTVYGVLILLCVSTRAGHKGEREAAVQGEVWLLREIDNACEGFTKQDGLSMTSKMDEDDKALRRKVR